MQYSTVIAADIAKHSFQCARFDHQALVNNRTYSRSKFERLLTSDRPVTIAMESCSGAQHWARLAKSYGHEVILVPPKTVAHHRLGQKTDANDALAIFEVARSVNFKPAVHKDIEIQSLQSLTTIRRRYQNSKTQLSNAIRGHLSEYGLVFAQGVASLKQHVPLYLEDADNGLPAAPLCD